MKNTFTEGNLTFTFSESWNVIKYDDHRYYRTLSGSSFSGVDFAGIYQCEKVVFIEVKNYLQYEGPIRDNSEVLVKKYGDKITDTLRLIDIVQRYHRRKWWYRTFISWIMIKPWLHRDWFFWTSTFELVKKKASYEFIFLIYCKKEDIPMFNVVLNQLKTEHHITNIRFVYNNTDNIQGLEFS